MARLLFVVRALPVHRLGGLELHARDLLVQLARMGWQIEVVTTAGGAEQGFGDAANAIRVIEVPGSKRGDYSVGFFRRVGPLVQQLCAAHNYEAVIAVDLAALALRAAAVKPPLYLLIHGTMTSEVPLDWRYWAHLGWRERLRALWRYKARLPLTPLFRRRLRRAAGVIVDSEFTRRELLRIVAGRGVGRSKDSEVLQFSRRVAVVPLGIDTSRYLGPMRRELQLAPHTLRICMLGRLQKIKGIKIALEAAQILAERGIDFKLSIGGTGSYREEAERHIQRYRLQGRVMLCGRIEPADLPAFFARHSLFLFPDLTQPAFGLVSVEAMYYGLPVVAARVGAVPEVVGESCGWLYDPWSADELAALLGHLAANPEEIIQKAEGVRQVVKTFTAEHMAERFVAALDALNREKK